MSIEICVSGVYANGNQVDMSVAVTLADGRTVTGNASCWPDASSPFGAEIGHWLSASLYRSLDGDLGGALAAADYEMALTALQAHILDAAKAVAS